MKEFDVIDRFFKRSGHKRKDVMVGIGDDAAITCVPQNQCIATTTDTLVSGVHFLPDTDPRSVAYKSVAVNLSDLAAMGAEPAWISLSLSIPDPDVGWLESFCDGLFELTEYYSVQLIGGDTVAGPLSLTITAQGFIPSENALTRCGAKPGDWIYTTGTLGDAGAGLDILLGNLQTDQVSADYLKRRHHYPSPRILAGTTLRRSASSCIDVSDGLLSDLGHITKASGCGAMIDVARLPLSEALKKSTTDDQAIHYALSAGDDYELLFTVGEEFKSKIETAFASFNLNATCIGQITGAVGKIELKSGDAPYPYEGFSGFEHFNGK